MTLTGSRVIWANVAVPLYSSYCAELNRNRTCWINNVVLQGNLPIGINNNLNTFTGSSTAGPVVPAISQDMPLANTSDCDKCSNRPIGKTTSLTADGTTRVFHYLTGGKPDQWKLDCGLDRF